MAEGTASRTVAEALGEVEKHQGEEESRHRAELAEVDQEIENLEASMANLKQQLEALGKFREELQANLDSVSGGLHRKTYEALFAALREQAQTLAGRAAEVDGAEAEAREALQETLEDDEVKGLLDEYTQFKEQVEPALESFPASYREALEAKHVELEDKLREALGDDLGQAVELEADPVGVDVVLAVDAPDEVVEAVFIILPVVEQVHTAWTERGEDLQTWVAARVMHALYEVCHDLGQPGVQAMYGGHQGLLAVEAELGTGTPDEVLDKLQAGMREVFGAAPELQGARVELRPQPVDVDHLFPPEQPSEPAPAPQAEGEAQEATSAG